MKIFLRIVCSYLFFFSNQLVISQTVLDSINKNQLNEVVITGTRTERSVATLPLPIQIITGESIRKSGLSRLNEIIQEQTGLLVVPDFNGGLGIQIQGLDAAYVMILIDGQPLFGRSAGTLDLNRISVNNIARIEIIKGATSSLYGSEALAGVVNIITNNSIITEKLNGNVNYKLATFDTHDVSSNLHFGNQKLLIEIFGNYYKTNGYNLSDNSYLQTVEPYNNFTIQPKLKINFSKKINISFNSRFFKQNQQYKTQQSNYNYLGESKITELNNSLLVNHSLTDNFKLVYDLYATNYKASEYLNDQNNTLFNDSNFNQWFYRSEVRSHFKMAKNILTTGIGMNYETLERTYFENKEMLNSEYFFGQFEWNINKKWNILSGLRYDHHHQYQSQLSPKFAINYKCSDFFSLKASVGYGYKAPDLRQLYFNFTNSSVGYTVLGHNIAMEKLNLLQTQGQILFINSYDFSNSLKPESSINFNFGGFYKKEKLFMDYNFFYNSMENLIDTRVIAQKINGNNLYSYFNIDKIFTYGLELNSNYNLNEQISFSLGYQYLIAKDQTVIDKISAGQVFARDANTLSSFKLKCGDYFGLPNRSQHSGNFKVNYKIPSLNTALNARIFYKSKYGILDTNDNGIIDKYDNFINGYFLTNVSANIDLKYQISLQIGVINLFNYTDRLNIKNLPGQQFFTRLQYQF